MEYKPVDKDIVEHMSKVVEVLGQITEICSKPETPQENWIVCKDRQAAEKAFKNALRGASPDESLNEARSESAHLMGLSDLLREAKQAAYRIAEQVIELYSDDFSTMIACRMDAEKLAAAALMGVGVKEAKEHWDVWERAHGLVGAVDGKLYVYPLHPVAR
jgi:hypothetical protein